MVDFCLSGMDIDFNVVSSQIGISSAMIQKKECIKIKEYAKDTWYISTGYQEEMAVSVPFEQLIDKLHGKENIINDLTFKYNLECIFLIVIQAENGNGPEVVLTQKCVNFASKVNAEIHFDLYYY